MLVAQLTAAATTKARHHMVITDTSVPFRFPRAAGRPRGTYSNARIAARTSRDIATGRAFARSPHTGGVVRFENACVKTGPTNFKIRPVAIWRKLSEAEALDRLLSLLCSRHSR